MLNIDYSNCMADRVGEKDGLSEREWGEGLDRHAGLTQEVLAKLPQDAFHTLPADRKTLQEVRDHLEEISGFYDDMIVLGIGGSALGGISLTGALLHPHHNLRPGRDRAGKRIFFVDNVDPERINGLLDVVKLERAVVTVITKSGSTAETLAKFMVLLEAMKNKVGREYRKRFIFSTDPEKGLLRKIAREEGIKAFPIPPGVGGRFSVLTSVGLIPGLAAGIDMGRVLDGAGRMAGLCAERKGAENPALVHALLSRMLHERRGKSIQVFMPYCHSLKEMAFWFCQLWAESLGKRLSTAGKEIFAGQTPMPAIGATDQHSVAQLFNEGPNDKLLTFLGVTSHGREVVIPNGYPKEESLSYLGGTGLGTLLEKEREATAIALTNNRRPNLTISMAEVTPETVGELYMLFEISTAIAGRLYGVDAFDQPGVEAGKVATYALMGRKGYEKERERIEAAQGAGKRWRV